MRWSRYSAAFLTVGFICLFAVAPVSRAQSGNQQPLITQAIDETKLTLLPGNTHPLARAEFDRGAAPANLGMQRMLLVLGRSAPQEAALETLLEEQQDKSSPNFHKWLTPDEFGEQFGISDQDVQTIVAWLEGYGFQVAGVSRGRGVIEFSGTAQEVQQAFHTAIHSYAVNGGQYWANASDPAIPSALAPAVIGIDSLNNFGKKAAHHLAGITARQLAGEWTKAQPALTYECATNPDTGAAIYCNALGPYDFAAIYNVLPLWTASPAINGTGESIAIVGRSNINLEDVSDFQSLFGLPNNPPQVILDGPDPGLVPGDETEADLDVEWSGGIAQGATIMLVVSESTETTDGVDLSAEYAVDNNIAPIMSESFGSCELDMGTAGNQFYNNLWEQAAAQGISVFVAAGDQGSAGCDNFQGTAPQAAQEGLQVNGIASTPYDVSVGGTDFNDFFNESTYWNTTNNPTTQQSAKGYIPETTWNDSCTNAIFGQIGYSTNAEVNCNNSELSSFVVTIAGSGGVSGCTNPTGSTPLTCTGGYGKPPWQTASGVPSDGKRDLPDVSLFASNGFVDNAFAICEADITAPCNANNVVQLGGTSGSSPSFAGLMALVDQKEGTREGDPNFVFYKLAQKQSASACNSSTGPASTCVFNDVTSGTIAMPCVTGSVNCTTASTGDQYGVLSGYSTTAGYDLATGLGSVNANNLVNDWNTVKFTASSTTLTLNGGSAVNIVHGSAISVNVAVSPTSPEPTGNVSLIATQGSNSYGFDTMTLANGAASGSTNMLPGGSSYTVEAHYEGDVNYGGSNSNAVTVTPEASKTFANLLTFDANGNLVQFGASSFTYGGGFALFRVDVGNSEATVTTAGISSTCSSRTTNCPTGSVSLSNNGAPFEGGSLSLNIEGYAETQPLAPGTYAISASYPGDSSYSPSTATANFTIAKAPTTIFAAIAGLPLQYGDDEEVVATVITNSEGVAPTGTFSFFLDGAPLTTSALVNEGFPYNPNGNPPYATLSATGSATFVGLGNHVLTAQYSGDANYVSGTSGPTTITVTQALPDISSWGASPATVNVNQQTTLEAQMFGSTAGVAPTGTMTFFVNGKAVAGSVTYTPLAHSLEASVPYTPNTPGTDSITVSYSGDKNYLSTTSPVPATLTVLGPDFVMNASGTTAQTVTSGQAATFTNAISVSSEDGFSAAVKLSCTTPAAATKCSVSPNALTPGSGSATVTVTTTAYTSMLAVKRIDQRQNHFRLWIFILCMLLFVWLRAFIRRQRAVFSTPIFLATLLLMTAIIIGCSGGSSTSSPPPPPPSGTQSGTYLVTVTGTSGSLTHTVTLNLTVQ